MGEKFLINLDNQILNILNDVGIGGVICGFSSLITESNGVFLKMVGKKRQEVVNHKIEEFVASGDREKISKIMEGSLKNRSCGTPGSSLTHSIVENLDDSLRTAPGENKINEEDDAYPVEVELENTGGRDKKLWAQVRFCRLNDSQNGEKYLFTFIDVTRKVLQEKKDRNEINFLRNIITTSVEGIVAADMKGNIILFNKGAENLLEWKAEEVIGKLNVSKLYPPGVAKDLMRKLRSPDYGGVGRLTNQNIIGIAKGGERIPVSLSASIIYEDGKEVASVGIFTDLRERTRLQKKLEEMKLQVFQSEKMASLGKLAAGVAHEINNPLAGILLYAHIIKKKASRDKSIMEDTDRIIGDATRCKEIVQGLLEFARQREEKKVVVDLNRTASQGLSLLVSQAIFRNIEVIKELSPDIPKILANPTQLSQIIINLVMNAIDAMPDGGKLIIRTLKSENDGYVKLEIEDTGIGIPPENLPKIFDPFFTTKEVGKGTGLGLSVVYGIVEDHRGKINVKSAPGQGTTVTIDFPACEKGEILF